MVPIAAAAAAAPAVINKVSDTAAQHRQTIGMIAASLTPEARAYRQTLRADTRAMKAGKLGYSEAQKAQMLNQTNQAVQTAQLGANDEARRLAAAGGLQGSGTSQGLMNANAKAASDALAQSRTNIELQSQQTAEARRAEILGRILAQRQQQQANIMAAMGNKAEGPQVEGGTADYGALLSTFGGKAGAAGGAGTAGATGAAGANQAASIVAGMVK